jgi:multiple sugar transport system permease protein
MYNAANRRRLGHLVPLVGCTILIILYAGPLLFGFLSSLKVNSKVFVYSLSSFWPLHWGIYSTEFSSLVAPLKNAALIAIGTTVVTMVLASSAAYGIARLGHGRTSHVATVTLAFLVLLQLVPQATAATPLYAVLVQVHLVNTIPGVVIADSALMVPFAILVLRPHFMAVPHELEEAARIDGAGSVGVFCRVAIPLARNGVAMVSAIIAILVWGEFVYAVTFLSSGSLFPISVTLLDQVGQYGTNWNGILSIAVITSIPVLVVFVFTHRQLRAGVTAGAVR